MSLFDEDKLIKKIAHDIGADISMLSVDELKARISLLQSEIARLDIEITAKSSSRNVAESLFKK